LYDRQSARILIIDDEKGMLDLLSYELGGQGYQVVTAQNGREGLERVKRDRFQLVITDVKMPGMDGVEVLQEIKKLDPDLEVIMTTGFGTIETAVAAMKKGAYDFIQKPFNLNEVTNLIEKVLERSELKSLVALYEASKAIFSSVRIDSLLPILADLAQKLLRADDASIMLPGLDGKLAIAASRGLEGEAEKAARLALGERIALGQAAQEPVIFEGPIHRDPRFSDLRLKDSILSAVVCPLRSKDKVLGALCAARTASDVPFNYSDLRHAQIYLSQVAQAIDNARLVQELENKMEDLKGAYAELEKMKDELAQAEKLRAIGELAAGVAHELNNPLTTIIGLADLLIEDGDPSAERMQDFSSIKSQADRCRKIIVNLLHFARKQRFEMRQASVNEIMENTLELVKYELQSSGIEMVKELDQAVPTTRLDPNRIQQVFLNLVTNARDALAGRERPKLVVRSSYAGDLIRVSVSDNGSGIPEKVLQRIFDPFFTTKDVGKGTGLGLSISFGIVKDHGGAIRAESREGEGTAFTVELPVTI